MAFWNRREVREENKDRRDQRADDRREDREDRQENRLNARTDRVGTRQGGRTDRTGIRQSERSYRYGEGGASKASTAWADASGKGLSAIGEGLSEIGGLGGLVDEVKEDGLLGLLDGAEDPDKPTTTSTEIIPGVPNIVTGLGAALLAWFALG